VTDCIVLQALHCTILSAMALTKVDEMCDTGETIVVAREGNWLRYQVDVSSSIGTIAEPLSGRKLEWSCV
jgi:hypothetical protein